MTSMLPAGFDSWLTTNRRESDDSDMLDQVWFDAYDKAELECPDEPEAVWRMAADNELAEYMLDQDLLVHEYRSGV